MSTVSDLLNNYDQILKCINETGFTSARLFKGFDSEEEHDFNLLLDDRFDEDSEPKAQMIRRLELKQKLIDLMPKTKISLCTEEDMNTFYRSQLSDENSVVLLESIPKNDLDRIFGLNWQFNLTDVTSSTNFWNTTGGIKKKNNPIQHRSQELSQVQKVSSLIISEIIKTRQQESQFNIDSFLEEVMKEVKKEIKKSKIDQESLRISPAIAF